MTATASSSTLIDAISPHFCPLVHAFATPDLAPILARSSFTSLSHFLSAFESSVEKVTVRSSNYEARTLSRFGVRFVDRPLPDSFGQLESNPQRRRSSTLTNSNKSPHLASSSSPIASNNPSAPVFPASLSTATVPAPTPAPAPTPSATTAAFASTTTAQRDELFLDSLSSLVSQRVDGWLNQPARRELNVVIRSEQSRRNGVDRDNDLGREPEEGWEGAAIEDLTPWYAAMRDEVLRRREMVEYDTFAWPVASESALLLKSSASCDGHMECR